MKFLIWIQLVTLGFVYTYFFRNKSLYFCVNNRRIAITSHLLFCFLGFHLKYSCSIWRFGNYFIIPQYYSSFFYEHHFLFFYMWCFAQFGTICFNFKNVKSTHGGVFLLVKLQASACRYVAFRYGGSQHKFTCLKSTIETIEKGEKLLVKAPERRNWCCFGVFIVNFEHSLNVFLGFQLLAFSIYLFAEKKKTLSVDLTKVIASRPVFLQTCYLR